MSAGKVAMMGAAPSTSADEHGTDGSQTVADSRRVQLPPQQMAALRAQQAERRAAFERQRQQVGPCQNSQNYSCSPLQCIQLEQKAAERVVCTGLASFRCRVHVLNPL